MHDRYLVIGQLRNAAGWYIPMWFELTIPAICNYVQRLLLIPAHFGTDFTYVVKGSLCQARPAPVLKIQKHNAGVKQQLLWQHTELLIPTYASGRGRHACFPVPLRNSGQRIILNVGAPKVRDVLANDQVAVEIQYLLHIRRQ